MMACLSGTVAAKPIGRSYAKPRIRPLRHSATELSYDWVIPSTRVVVTVASMAWIAVS